MKYLVTGATGLIGNNVVRHLLDAGEAVTYVHTEIERTRQSLVGRLTPPER